jgi:cellulose synthase (UDP-forming)
VSAHRRTALGETGRINLLEVAAYTSAILLVGAIAAGWFDVMLPW